MKFSIAALALAATAWANPLVSVCHAIPEIRMIQLLIFGPQGNSVAAALKARTDAAYFHAGSDLVLRAVSSDFTVVGTAALTERQAAELHAAVDQPMAKRADVDERQLLGALSARAATAPVTSPFDLEKRQTCSGFNCHADRCGSSVCSPQYKRGTSCQKAMMQVFF
jgi:hypothetical protein